MHRSAQAPTKPRRSTHQLREGGPYWYTERQGLTMTSIRDSGVIAWAHRADDSDTDRLLALAKMSRSRNYALQEQLLNLLFEGTDLYHSTKPTHALVSSLAAGTVLHHLFARVAS